MTHPPQYIGAPGAVGNYVVQYYDEQGGVWFSPTRPEFASLASAEQAAMAVKTWCPWLEVRVVRRLENGISKGLFTA